MVTVTIDLEKCNYCMECVDVCISSALTHDGEEFLHNSEDCANCEVCMDLCENDAITIR